MDEWRTLSLPEMERFNMRFLIILLFMPLTAFAFLNTTDDTARITVNVGADRIDGHTIFYLKGKHKLTNDSNSYVPYCIVIDPIKLATMQRIPNTTLYSLLWFTPSCSDTGGQPPCLPTGAIVNLDSSNPWCNL